MSAQHTPGPWSVLDHHGVHVLAEGGLTVATVAHQLDFARVPGRVQIQNASLIAAAPELLEALQHLRKAFIVSTGEASPFAKVALAPADAAIAKATGAAS